MYLNDGGGEIMTKFRKVRLQKCIDDILDLSSDVSEIAMDEQDSFDSAPEGLQETRSFKRVEENAEVLFDVSDKLSESADALIGILGVGRRS